MGWIIVVVIVAVVAVVGWLLWSRSRKPAPSPLPPPAPARVSRVTDAAPMTGLEAALDQATDSSGRNMRDKIETSTAIDDLIVPEDTGPILRRALDSVEHSDLPPEPDATGGKSPTNEG